jgi:hypothetical protein
MIEGRGTKGMEEEEWTIMEKFEDKNDINGQEKE